MQTHEPAQSIPDWAAVPFPYPARTAPAIDADAVRVPHSVIDQLGIEEITTYVRLASWYSRGEPLTLERLADELWFGERHRAMIWVESLADRGLVVAPMQWLAVVGAQVEEDHAAEARAAAPAEPARFTGESWEGAWPLASGATCPPPGAAVVYYALDVHGQVLYVGSTGNFRGRTRDHSEARRSIPWAGWTAHGCNSRAGAYRMEAAEIERLDPPQNRREARKDGGR